MEIRKAVKEDLPELLTIYNEAIRTLTATFDLKEQSLEERQAWFDQHGENYPLIIAEIDNQIAGYCSLSPYRPKAAYAYTAELSIYLSSKFRGRGIGKQLIKEILEKAKQLHFHTIIAIITGGNASSVKLHERFGFKYVGCIKEAGLKFGEWQDVCFYQFMVEASDPLDA
ncbi:N-acetyltransferase [Pullulanibacillus camelliae]|uniref:N-acetyltransferase n=1 Tax=Pullulanibacillus camelliae TaxID=1707096 RepID=A0A8J2VU80_9BACL|nr:GNAT family N-acetyltransferase [Pullulanibacillus camelliae]GGE38073.1 N-acetyltransferase [Pullulanibacillus camelliae]